MTRVTSAWITALVIVATIFVRADGARQNAAPPQVDEPAVGEMQEAEHQALTDAIERSEADARAEFEKNYQATRQQRADFDRKMDDLADRHSKDAGTRVTYVQSIGDDGLPERGEVWFVRRGFITDRAEFDAAGNTTGLVETPTGRALRSLEAHAPKDVKLSTSFTFTNGPDGRSQIRLARYSGPDGIRGVMRFNQDGVAYYGEFFRDGERTGGFYDPGLEWRDPPPRGLMAPPVPRVATQPCEPCRAMAAAYNALVERTAPLQSEMARLARENATSTPGPQRQAIELRFDELMRQWQSLEPQFDAALASLRACQSACVRPQTTQMTAVTQTAAGGAAPRTSASASKQAVGISNAPALANPQSAMAIHNAKGQNTFVVLDMVPASDGTFTPELEIAAGDNGSGDFGFNAGVQFKTEKFGVGLSYRSTTPLQLVGAADFNGDGADDLAFIDSQANLAGIALNDGTNFFLQPSFRETGGFVPVSAAIADVNDDDELDFIVAHQGAQTAQGSQSLVSVLLGNGSGQLAPSGSLLQVPNFALSIVGGIADIQASRVPRIVDFNNDGFPDFAVTSTRGAAGVLPTSGFTPTVTLILNRADAPGTFVVQPPIALIDNVPVEDAAVADVNGDGQMDIVAGGSAGVQVLPGVGNGTFGAGLTFPLYVSGLGAGGNVRTGTGIGVGGANFTLSVADFNADGSPDLVVNGTSMLLNQTAFPGALPNFRSSIYLFGNETAGGVRVTRPARVPEYLFNLDLNGDGKADPIRIIGSDVRIIDGATTPIPPPPLPPGPTFQEPGPLGDFEVAMSTTGDFNGDGNEDVGGLVITPGAGGSPQVSVKTYLGAGDGTFGLPVSLAFGAGVPISVASGDLDGDGADEVVIGTGGGTPQVRVFQMSDGQFAAAQNIPLEGQPIDVTVGRFNGDAFGDIAYITSKPGADDALSFVPGGESDPSGGIEFGATIGGPIIKDKTHFFLSYERLDEQQDIAIGTSSGVQVFENTSGAGSTGFTFEPAEFVGAGTAPIGAVMADVNGDDRMDVISLNRGSGTVSVNIANAGGGYGPPRQAFTVGANPISLTLTNVNNDGIPDIAVGNAPGGYSPGQVSLFTGTAGGAFSTVFPIKGIDAFNAGGVLTGNFNTSGPADELIAPGVPGEFQIGHGLVIKATSNVVQNGVAVGTFETRGLLQDLDGDMTIDPNEIFNFDGTPCTGPCLNPFQLDGVGAFPFAPGPLAVSDYPTFTINDPFGPSTLDPFAPAPPSTLQVDSTGVTVSDELFAGYSFGSSMTFGGIQAPGAFPSLPPNYKPFIFESNESNFDLFGRYFWIGEMMNFRRLHPELAAAPTSVTVTNQGGGLRVEPGGTMLDARQFQAFTDFGDLPIEITRVGEVANTPGASTTFTPAFGGSIFDSVVGYGAYETPAAPNQTSNQPIGGAATAVDNAVAPSVASAFPDNLLGFDECPPGPPCTTFGDLSAFDQIGGTNPDDRDPLTQYMMIEIVTLKAAENQIQMPALARAALTLWDRLRDMAAGHQALASRRATFAPHGGVPVWRQGGGGRPGGGRIQTLLTSLGTSTGEAFEIQVAGDGKQPLNLAGNGIVVEPLKRAVAQQARQQISRLASRNPVTQKLDAYCVEFLRQPPSLGTIFRVAGPEIQERFAPMRSVLQAAQRLQQAGALTPDSDPAAYFSAIKQWALWTRERGFDERGYGDAFVEHTRKNARAAGVQWTDDIEKSIRSLIPARWSAITRILQTADRLR